jgi:hypothetical protein
MVQIFVALDGKEMKNEITSYEFGYDASRGALPLREDHEKNGQGNIR